MIVIVGEIQEGHVTTAIDQSIEQMIGEDGHVTITVEMTIGEWQ